MKDKKMRKKVIRACEGHTPMIRMRYMLFFFVCSYVTETELLVFA